MREFVMLAKTFDPTKHRIAGWYLSEKYDGQRCFWDGGISQGKWKADIPWANTLKDERYVIPQKCTGLWSRYGNVIHAPLWFIEKLPLGVMLDGELYIDRGQFQRTRKIISTIEPGPGWKDIRFLVFDNPAPQLIFQDGKINNPNFKKEISWAACASMVSPGKWVPYDEVYNWMAYHSTFPNEHIGVVEQTQLSWNEKLAVREMYEALEHVSKLGGEGLMLRRPDTGWVPHRTPNLLKVKPMKMDDAIVRGYMWSMDGKLRGLMGALLVEWQEKRFHISGFTDDERQLYFNDSIANGLWQEGQPCQDGVYSKYFPIGSVVKFRYASLTDDGLPREARYAR